MKKMYKFYCLFLFGNLLPFLIIELYFQDYFTIGVIIIIASIAFIICSSIESLKIKSMTQSDNNFKKIDYKNLLDRKELDKLASFYFFRKNFF